MPEDTDPQNAPDTVAVEPPPDATPEQPAQRQLQPGESMVHVNEEGMQIVMLPPPLPLTFRADKDLMRRIIVDWLHNDEAYWDVLVNARNAELETRKKHLTLVTDPATVKQITRSKNRLQV